jgi:hypothetical protein
MIELINLAIDITILLINDYHIRVREEQERQEYLNELKAIGKRVTEFNKKLKKDFPQYDWNNHIQKLRQDIRNKTNR